jgi:hypothetical protein
MGPEEQTVSGVFALATVNSERIGRIERWMGEHRQEHTEQRKESAEQHRCVVEKIDSLRDDLTTHRIRTAEKSAASEIESVKACADNKVTHEKTSAKVAVLWIVLGSGAVVALKLLGDLLHRLF